MNSYKVINKKLKSKLEKLIPDVQELLLMHFGKKAKKKKILQSLTKLYDLLTETSGSAFFKFLSVFFQ